MGYAGTITFEGTTRPSFAHFRVFPSNIDAFSDGQERAQQIGAIVYRNVDAVTWERLRLELPEIIPRGARNWKRYL